MPPRKSIKPPVNEPGGGVDARKSLKVPEDDTAPTTGQKSPSITYKASPSRETKKSIKPIGNSRRKTLAQIPLGLEGSDSPHVLGTEILKGPGAAIPDGTGGVEASSPTGSVIIKKKTTGGTGGGSKSGSSSSIKKSSKKSDSTAKGSKISVSVPKTSRTSIRLKGNPSLNPLGKKKKSARPHHPAISSFKQKFKKFLYLGPTRVSDVENREGDDEGEAVPLCNKKTLMITLILVIFLILLIVIIAVLRGGRGTGSNDTTTSVAMTTISSPPTTLKTDPISGCKIKFPGIGTKPIFFGIYCRNCFLGDKQKCDTDCCALYYASGSNNWSECKREC